MADYTLVDIVQQAYPKLWHACHVEHRTRGQPHESGLTDRESGVLAHIGHDGAEAGPLADHLGIAKSTLSAHITRLESLDLEIAVQRSRNATVDALLAAKRKILETHGGFARDILAYHPGRDAWRVVAHSPEPLPVTTIAVPWSGALVLPSGEVRPGVRTTAVLRVTPVAP